MHFSKLLLPLFLGFTFIFASCDREEDDIIVEPSETSTVVTGYISTPEGAPFAGIPVAVDFRSVSIFGTTIIHKAKGTTDKSGYYKIFFEAEEDVSMSMQQRVYLFSADLSALSKDKYIISENISVPLYGEKWKGETSTYNFIIPLKKLVKVIVSNDGLPVKEGTYAVRDKFPFIETDRFPWPAEWISLESVEIPAQGTTTILLPCALEIENTISLVYTGNDEINYESGIAAGDSREIVLTSTFSDDIALSYTTPE
ncbi:MAG: hypothetical protein HDS65_06210 [Bacteroidales bacterium]|nr:hypothetical protein [Bacteroidales bacterium]